jgi:hypothetical protein
MSNTIQIKRSSTASSVPTAGQLAQGELAVNLVDKKLYTKDNTNAVVLLNPEFSINGLTTTTVATDDFLPFADTSDSGNPKKVTVQDVVALGLNATGSAPTYAARAWVNFDGTTAGTNPAPMTIRGSGNVSSVTRTATGQFTVNFTAAMPDANYGFSLSAGTASSATFAGLARVLDTTSLQLSTIGGGGTAFNYTFCSVTIFR